MSKAPRIEPSGDVVARVGSTALAVPDAYVEDAWTSVAELVTESYRFCAPQKLRNRLDR